MIFYWIYSQLVLADDNTAIDDDEVLIEYVSMIKEPLTLSLIDPEFSEADENDKNLTNTNSNSSKTSNDNENLVNVDKTLLSNGNLFLSLKSLSRFKIL